MVQKAPKWQWEGDATGLNASITQDAAAPSTAGAGIAKKASGTGTDSATSSISSTNILEDTAGSGNAIWWRIDNAYGQSSHMFDADFSALVVLPNGMADGNFEAFTMIKDDESKFPFDLFVNNTVATRRVDLNLAEAEFIFSSDPLQFTFSDGEQDGMQIMVTWEVATNTLSLLKDGVVKATATLDTIGPGEFLIEAIQIGYGNAAQSFIDLIRLYDYVPSNPEKLITGVNDYHDDGISTAASFAAKLLLLYDFNIS